MGWIGGMGRTVRTLSPILARPALPAYPARPALPYVTCPALEVDRHVQPDEPRRENLGRYQIRRAGAVVLIEGDCRVRVEQVVQIDTGRRFVAPKREHFGG